MLIFMTTLKQFLKPEWRKILIFVVLLILIVLEGVPVWRYPLCKMGAPCPKYLDFISLNEFIISKQFWDRGLWFDWYVFVTEIFLFYIISCLIVLIYDKFKRLKSKK